MRTKLTSGLIGCDTKIHVGRRITTVSSGWNVSRVFTINGSEESPGLEAFKTQCRLRTPPLAIIAAP